MLVRQATAADIPYILDLYKKGLDELGQEWKESLLLKKIVNSYQLAPCFLLEIDGIIRGMAGLTAVTTSHNGVASLDDYMFYVEPDSRNIKTLNALVSKAKEFAMLHDIPLRVNFSVKDDLKTRERLLKMNGFEVRSVMGVYHG